MKNLRILIGLLLVGMFGGSAQENDKISTLDFVQILDGNRDETMFYFENNWKILRQMAVERDYIHSYDVMETPFSEEAPFELILITTYKDEAQYNLRESHFRELIEERGELKLLNNKKPNEFRRTIFNKEKVKHWE
ncbi:hypothetical protein [Flagellimonas sp.]|uniref:hypothetical protein n=1 Tax=Flagellimonas sp. TaxID=2058762 RepID=UPI003F49D335